MSEEGSNTSINIDTAASNQLKRELSNVLGHTFEELLRRGYNLVQCCIEFMNSDLAKEFFIDGTIFSQSYKYIASLCEESFGPRLIKLAESEIYDIDVAYWMGYLISEIIQTAEEDRYYLNAYTIQWIYDGYDTLHTQTCAYVLRLMKDEYKGIMCKYCSVLL